MKVGILGGTFNPVHLGHIKLAEEASKNLELDKLIFIPVYISPHKQDKDIISWQDRYRMLELAIEGNSNFEISSIEIEREGTSYSINTIKELKNSFGDAGKLFFITGSDSISELDTWKDIDQLKKLCTFVIVTRPGFDVKTQPVDTTIVSLDTPAISSTEIRRCIKENKPFKKFLPQNVYKYLTEKKLYL